MLAGTAGGHGGLGLGPCVIRAEGEQGRLHTPVSSGSWRWKPTFLVFFLTEEQVWPGSRSDLPCPGTAEALGPQKSWRFDSAQNQTKAPEDVSKRGTRERPLKEKTRPPVRFCWARRPRPAQVSLHSLRRWLCLQGLGAGGTWINMLLPSQCAWGGPAVTQQPVQRCSRK